MKRPTFRFNLNTLFSHPYAFGVYFYCHYMPERSGARCLFLTLAEQKTNKSDWLCHRVSFSSHTSILMHAYRYVPSRIHIAHSTLTSLAYLVTTVRKYFLVNVMLIFSKNQQRFLTANDLGYNQVKVFLVWLFNLLAHVHRNNFGVLANARKIN